MKGMIRNSISKTRMKEMIIISTHFGKPSDKEAMTVLNRTIIGYTDIQTSKNSFHLLGLDGASINLDILSGNPTRFCTRQKGNSVHHFFYGANPLHGRHTGYSIL